MGNRMDMMVWDDSQSVDNEQLDNQHKEIIVCMNEICSLLLEMQIDRARAVLLLSKLQSIMDFHFQSEERYLADNHYPVLTEHAASHENYSTLLSNCYINGLDNDTLIKIGETLIDWHIQHFLTEDMAYRDYFRAQKQHATVFELKQRGNGNQYI